MIRGILRAYTSEAAHMYILNQVIAYFKSWSFSSRRLGLQNKTTKRISDTWGMQQLLSILTFLSCVILVFGNFSQVGSFI